MSKLMIIAGIVLAAVGIALGLMIFFSPGSVVGWGLTPQVAIEILIGGILAIGLGGVIGAVDDLAGAAPAGVAFTAVQPAAAAVTAEEGLSPATSETLRALDQAKTEIHKAFGEAPAEELPVTSKPSIAEAASEAEETPAAAEVEADAAANADEGQLYVLEEKIVRGRPARILSDGTIEAETDEGWMRFENLEHLNEYLDAMAPGE